MTDQRFVEDLPARLEQDPASAAAVQSEASGRAALRMAKGDPSGAREVLLGAGDALAKAGKLDEAKQVYAELTRAPLANTPVNLARSVVSHPEADAAYGFKSGKGNDVTIDPARFDSTTGALGQLKLAQAGMQGKMEQLLGHSVDPRDPDQAREYFAAFAKGHDFASVASEYGAYLKTFFKHSGENVAWSKDIPMDERGARTKELLAGQKADDAGRTIVDCEGFAYLTEHILAGVKDEDGQRPFGMIYASRQDHVISALTNPDTRELIIVNNDQVSAPKKFPKDTDAIHLLGEELLTAKGVGIFAVGLTQSRSQPQSSDEKHAPPRIGSLVWDGLRGGVRGSTSETLQQDYLEYAQTHLVADGYGGFMEWKQKHGKEGQ